MESQVKRFLEKLGKFNEEEIDAIIAHTQVETFKKGDLILRQGKTADKCYFVLEGCLRQYHMSADEEKTTGFFVEGQLVVLYASYLKKTLSDYYLSCLEDCILVSGTREQELELQKKYPKLEFLTHTLMLEGYDKAEKHITFLSCYKPEDRYLFLLKNQPELLNRVPLHYIASFLGVTPESFSRIRKRILKNNKLKQ